jgi:hypothetical protein
MRIDFLALLLVWMTAFSTASKASALTANYGAVGAGSCSMNGVPGTNGTTNGNPGIVGSLQSAASSLTASVSCSGPNNFSASGTATANFNQITVAAVMNGIGIFQLNSTASDLVTIGSPDLPAGTQLRVSVPFIETGTYTYSGLNLTVNPIVTAILNGNTIVEEAFGAIFTCDNMFCTGSGNVNTTFNSSSVILKVGQSYDFAFGFDVMLDNSASNGVINFGDPSFPFFQVTDPVTGALISDVTIQGQSGTVYGVNNNLAAVPEPLPCGLVGAGLLGVAWLVRLRRREPNSLDPRL